MRMSTALLVSTPAPAIEQTWEEKDYWRWHYALKARLTYPNLSDEERFKLGNTENQNVGLLSIASLLTENGADVQYLAPSLEFSGRQRDKDFLREMLSQVEETRPDFVGFSSHTCGIPTAIEFSHKVKEVSPESKTVIGGPHANGTSRDTLEELMKNFDFAVRGKGEIPFLELVKGNKNADGIYYRTKGKEVITSISAVYPQGYPRPMNSLLNVDELPAARVFTSLGCRKGAQCAFCADMHNRGFVTRPVEDVLKEIRYLHENLGTRYFYFSDENLFLDKERALYVMGEINSLELDIAVGYQARIESADEDLIKKAAESGRCTEIQYGVESASQEILDMSRKGLRVKKVEEVCDLTKSHGISTHCYFLVGLPEETQHTAELTIGKMKELLSNGVVDLIEYRCVVPFPGAPIWNDAEGYGIRINHRDWKRYRGENLPAFDLDGLTSEQIYGFYLQGLKEITALYKERYSSEFGDKLPDVNVISAVTEGGF